MAPSTLKLKYNTASNKLQTTLGFWVDDVKLKLGITEKAFKDVNSAKEDLEIGIEKPGHFALEHHLHKKHTRFQFHSHADVFSKHVRMTFVHHIMAFPVTTIEASTSLDKHNKVIVKHNLAKKLPLVKYEYITKEYLIEPQFDFGAGRKDAWGLAVKLGHGRKNFAKVSYSNHKKEAELELHKKIDDGGPLKISATIDLDNVKKTPRLVIEKEWKFSK